MKIKELQRLLQHPYNRESWKEILLSMFPTANMDAVPEEIEKDTKKRIEAVHKILKFGSIRLGQDELIFLEVQLKEQAVDITRNRVGLRDLIKAEINPGLIDGALIVYYGANKEDWRLTFYSEKYELSDDGELVKETTHPKRYTYELGPHESCKTAANQLLKVISFGEENSLSTVLKAFSVQKVSKEFFDEYKHQYDKFVGHLTGKNWTKKGVQTVGERITQFQFFFKDTTDPEKEARDFVKKLLGRLVFLHFVQKKKWLGASDETYSDGDTNFIYNLFKAIPEDGKARFYSRWLIRLFFDTLNTDDAHTFIMPDDGTVYIPFLNGGLFERDETDKNTTELPIPAKLFSNPGEEETPKKRGFLDFLDAYNFTIHEDSPGDHTIAVDPEMLGHIFENLLEDNKDKGAYYTPKPIVHYMCQESLIEYLLTELTTEDTENSKKEELRGHLEDFIKKQEASNLVSYTEAILTALKEVKVCDPAIGSGAFPMGILQEIYQAVETLYQLQPDSVIEIWEFPDNNWHPAHVKKQIIQHSIYGVDIEKGAVDIARLRFWLSLIVDEEEPKPLPNLDYKIVVGNSLLSKFEGKYLEIGWDITGNNEYEEEIIAIGEKVAELQKTYFESKGDKEKLSSKIRTSKIELIQAQLKLNKRKFEVESSMDGTLFEKTEQDAKKELAVKFELEEFKKLEKRLEQLNNDSSIQLDYFDYKLDFPEVLNPHLTTNPGFDIVIANPPYMRVQEIQKTMPEDKQFLEKKFSNARASYDLANLFFELAVMLGKKNSTNCFIFPHKFFNSASTKVFRDYLFKGKYIDRIVHFGANMIFNDADTYTCITLFSPKPNEGFWIQKFGLKEDYLNLMNQSEKYSFVPYSKLKLASKLYGSNQWVLFSTDVEYDVFKKIYSNSVKLQELFEDIFQGIATSKDPLYVVEDVVDNGKTYTGSIFKGEINVTVEKEFFKPLLKGADTHRYEVLETDKVVFFPYKLANGKSKFVELDELRKKYPLTYSYVVDNEKEFKSRERGKAGNMKEWYAYIYPKNLTKFEQDKLSSMEICTNHPNVALNDSGFYHATTVYSWVKKDYVKESYEFFLAVANSNLIWWFIMNTGDTLRGDARRFKSNYLNPFPLPTNVSEKTEKTVKEKVLEVIQNKSEGKDTSSLEQQIDTLVYKLYNLTWEEVQVVDPEFGLSEAEYEGFGVEGK